MTSDDLNRHIPMPPGNWFLDYRVSHALVSRLGDPVQQAAQAALGPAFTLISRGRVAAHWGLVIPWVGLAEGWLVADREILRPIGLPFTRGARRFCELAHEQLGVRRFQVHVQTSNASFMMWAHAAGFTLEAKCEAYLPDGGDVMLMAKVWR